MEVQRCAEMLRAMQSQTNQERKAAEQMYDEAKKANPEQLIAGFIQVLGEASLDEVVRRQAAVLLRQLVNRNDSNSYVFPKCSQNTKEQVAVGMLNLFEKEANPKLQRKIGEVISKLAVAVFDKDDPVGWLSPQAPGWPTLLEKVLTLSDPSKNVNPPSCESSLRLTKDLVRCMHEDIVKAQQALGGILQASLGHQDTKIKVAAFLLICEIVCYAKKKDWAVLRQTADVLVAVVQQTTAANLHEELEECLEAYNEVAETEPDFFKEQLTRSLEPAKTLSTFVKTRQGVDNGVRKLALEWLVTYTEQKHKWLAKHLPALPALAVECCMDLMLEVEDGDEELKAWIERMDDEEGEEDADELYHVGEEAIDRVVEKCTMENIGQTLFAVVGKYSAMEQWQAKFAALGAVKQTVEYLEEDTHVNEVAKLLIAHVEHPHPRVRYMSLHAIGQLANDQAPEFQDNWHSTVMPVLLQKMNDPIDRVASMSMSAFVSFGEELDKALMLQYSGNFMQALVGKLQSSNHRMVQEESITSIAVIAGVIEKDFAQYYDGMMPLLKKFVMTAVGEKQSRLRGKAFECMSLLGVAVGKDKFLPDAREALAEMFKMPTESDDLYKDYIYEASKRICTCLKKDFAPFLPELLPGIFNRMKIKGSEIAPGANNNDDDDDAFEIEKKDGKKVKVSTTEIQEAAEMVQMLWTFVDETKGAYFDFVKPTAEALMPYLKTSEDGDDLGFLFDDEQKGAVFSTWGVLIKSAKEGAAERGVQSDVSKQMLATYCQCFITDYANDEDPDTVYAAASGLAECLQAAGPGIVGGTEVLQLVTLLFQLIDQSLARTSEFDKKKDEFKMGAPADLNDDEDEEEDEDSEETCRRTCEEALGAVMEVAPQEFLGIVQQIGLEQRLQQWLGSKTNKTLGLFLACDLLKNLKEHSKPLWPILMPAIFQALADKDPDIRVPAAYAVNLAASIPDFKDAAPEAFRTVGKIVSAKPPKKRDEKAKLAADNAVAALLSLARHQPAQCPPEVPAFQLVVGKLPLQEDYEEACKVHAIIADLVLAQDQGLLGPNAAHLGKILSALAEVYHQEHLCEKETDEKVLQIFKMIPQDRLVALASNFTEKQQKKIEGMLSS